jgi:hypothetical protein
MEMDSIQEKLQTHSFFFLKKKKKQLKKSNNYPSRLFFIQSEKIYYLN